MFTILIEAGSTFIIKYIPLQQGLRQIYTTQYRIVFVNH